MTRLLLVAFSCMAALQAAKVPSLIGLADELPDVYIMARSAWLERLKGGKKDPLVPLGKLLQGDSIIDNFATLHGVHFHASIDKQRDTITIHTDIWGVPNEVESTYKPPLHAQQLFKYRVLAAAKVSGIVIVDDTRLAIKKNNTASQKGITKVIAHITCTLPLADFINRYHGLNQWVTSK